MDQENSNDARPAEQVPPTPVYVKPAEYPEEYITIRVPKRKIKKFIKLALIIAFVLSLWMNLMFLGALARERHNMRGGMGFQRTAQFQINGGVYAMPGHNGANGKAFYGNGYNFGGGNTYYGNGGGQSGGAPGSYKVPSR